jgi:UDP-N-acetylmuramoyl-tripeptide--D-alanyl-D-alanine ligase
MGFSLETVVQATGGRVTAGQLAAPFSAVVIDGRSPPKGALFFAIVGENHDGHDFVGQAVSAGAIGAVVARGRTKSLSGTGDAVVIEVDDTVKALGALAAQHRRALDTIVVGVAGSNGKTTTKEILGSIFAVAAGADSLKTEGNLNNHLGVPLTLLRLQPSHKLAAVEMGISGLGELAYLAQMSAPRVGVIVSIAPEHLEGLGSMENVAKAEAEILDHVVDAVVPHDELLLAPHLATTKARIHTVGTEAGATLRVLRSEPLANAVALTVSGALHFEVQVPLVGAHNGHNAAMAAMAAHLAGVSVDDIVTGIARVKPAKHRAQLIKIADRLVLDDCYNASPLSMRAAIDALVAATPAGHRKVAVLADMLELGADSPSLHDDLGRYAGERVDYLITIGTLGARISAAADRLGESRLHTEDPHDVAERVLEVTKPGDAVLVKGSRGMRLERVLEALAEHR